MAASIPAAAQPQDGTWKGKTSQDKPLSIVVAGGGVKSLQLDWSIPLQEPCGAGGSPIAMTQMGGDDSISSKTSLAAIRSGKFEWSFEHFDGGEVTVKMKGTFDAKGALSGTLDLTANHCKGRVSLTWSAKRAADETAPNASAVTPGVALVASAGGKSPLASVRGILVTGDPDLAQEKIRVIVVRYLGRDDHGEDKVEPFLSGGHLLSATVLSGKPFTLRGLPAGEYQLWAGLARRQDLPAQPLRDDSGQPVTLRLKGGEDVNLGRVKAKIKL